ncbi:MAG: class I SAM-dependent methyltransferase [Candidatus Odinarchaeota archaeon]
MDIKELKLMTSPVKKLMLSVFEFKVFKWFLNLSRVNLTEKVILEAGCGSGYALELIYKEYKPKELVAFDLLPGMVNNARNLTSRKRIPVSLFTGSITDTGLPSEKFDGIFIFTVFHHVPEWKKAMKEMNRVLKPGGIMLINEHDRTSVDRIEKYFRVKHPTSSRFEWADFKKNLEAAGFEVIRELQVILGIGLNFLMSRKTSSAANV